MLEAGDGWVGLGRVLATEGTIPVAAVLIVTREPQSFDELPIMPHFI